MKKPAVTLKSLDARVCDVEKRIGDVERKQDVAEGKLDTIIAMMDEHAQLQRVRINSRTRIVVALLGAIATVGGAIVGVLMGGCV